MSEQIAILVKHQMLLSRHMAACSDPDCNWRSRRAPDDTALNLKSPVMVEFAEHVLALLEASGFGDVEDAWDRGAVYAHNADGRLIDKREANPYPKRKHNA